MTDYSKHTLRLREGDFKTIQEAYPKNGATDIIRRLVSSFVDTKLRSRLSPEELKRITEEMKNVN